jgi:hypothetical protein
MRILRALEYGMPPTSDYRELNVRFDDVPDHTYPRSVVVSSNASWRKQLKLIGRR